MNLPVLVFDVPGPQQSSRKPRHEMAGTSFERYSLSSLFALPAYSRAFASLVIDLIFRYTRKTTKDSFPQHPIQ